MSSVLLAAPTAPKLSEFFESDLSERELARNQGQKRTSNVFLLFSTSTSFFLVFPSDPKTKPNQKQTVALFSSSPDPEFISGGDSAYVPGVSAVDWGNGHIEQPYISGWGSGGSSSWGGRKSGGSSWTKAAATPAKSSGGGWGKKRRSSEVSPPVEAEAAKTEVQAATEQKNPE